jgi:hypothetical protein
MKHNRLLLITSLISIVLFTLHFADDIVRGIEKGDLSDYGGIPLTAAWLFTALALAERRAGLVILLLFSMGAAGVPALHMSGAGLVGGRIAGSSGMLLWTWTLIAMGVTGMTSIILAVSEFWRLQRESRAPARDHARIPA